MGKLAAILTWVLIAVVSCSVIKILLVLDYNKKVYDHVPGPCKRIDGIRHSITDIELFPDGHAIISSGYDIALLSDVKKKRKGRLFAYDFSPIHNLNRTLKPAVDIKLKYGKDQRFMEQGQFNPVGLSSYTSREIINLYVINSLVAHDTVECFIYDKKLKIATHTKTIQDHWIYNAYDLKAVGPDKFFLTNQHYFRWRLLRMIEVYLLLNLGNLIYFDGKSSKVVDSRLTTPRGLAMDKEEKLLHVSLGLQESIRAYDVQRDGSIEKHTEMSLLSTANKLFIEPQTGDLYISAFPVLHEALSLKTYSVLGKTSSHILRVKIPDKNLKQWIISEIFASGGSFLSGSEIAIYYNSFLIIGSLGGKLMICEAPITDSY